MILILTMMMMVLLIVIVKWPAGTHNCLACQIILSLRKKEGSEILHAVLLCRTTSICAGQPQSVQNNLNLCRTTSICAKQPQFMQNNLNSCREKKPQKVTAYFRRLKHIFEPEIFSLARGYI